MMPILLSFLLLLILILFTIRWINKYSVVRCNIDTNLIGKVAIITGSNTGIGLEIARDFARRGARVILACRNMCKGQKAVEEIMKTTGNSNIALRQCDLGSLKNVRIFAEDILNSEDRLDILVLNAGMSGFHELTEDGFDIIWQVNHLGHFLLVQLLTDLLKSSSPSRVILTSSMAHRFGKLDLSNIAKQQSYVPFALLSYCDSKLVNVVYGRELSRRLIEYGVSVYSYHPGVIHTNILDQIAVPIIKIYFIMLSYLCNKTADDGAQTAIWLALEESVVNMSGKYFADCKQVNYNPVVDDPVLGRELWNLSEACIQEASC